MHKRQKYRLDFFVLAQKPTEQTARGRTERKREAGEIPAEIRTSPE